jgi:hypothetical protein
MSNHGNRQNDLHASFGIAHGMDHGVRSEGTAGLTTSSTMTDVQVFAGDDAQVIIMRDSTDDYWWYAPSEMAIRNSIGVSLSRITCTGTFTARSIGGGC